MHGGVHSREVRVPHGSRVARDGVCKQQLLDIIRLMDSVSQPPDSVLLGRSAMLCWPVVASSSVGEGPCGPCCINKLYRPNNT